METDTTLIKMTISEFKKIKDLNIFNLHKSDILFENTNKLSNIAIASAITAMGRVTLMEDALFLEKEYGVKLAYCDTDSHFVIAKKGLSLLGVRSPYGAFFDPSKAETEIFYAVFVKPKFYIYKYKDIDGFVVEVNKLKGASKNIDQDAVVIAIETNGKYIVEDIKYVSTKDFHIKGGLVNKSFDCINNTKRIWLKNQDKEDKIPKDTIAIWNEKR